MHPHMQNTAVLTRSTGDALAGSHGKRTRSAAELQRSPSLLARETLSHCSCVPWKRGSDFLLKGDIDGQTTKHTAHDDIQLAWVVPEQVFPCSGLLRTNVPCFDLGIHHSAYSFLFNRV